MARRLIGILIAALLIALGVTGYGVQAALHGYLNRATDEDLRQLALNARQDPRFLSRLASSDNQTTGLYGGHLAVRFTLDGNPAATVDTYSPGESARPDFRELTSQQAEDLGGHPYALDGVGDDDGWRAVSLPLVIPSSGSTGTLTLALPIANIDRAVSYLQLLTLSIGAAGIAVCALLGSLAIRRAFQPLTEVEETAAAIAAGDLSRRIPERPASTEVGRLTGSLNGMLVQIEAAFRDREASEARTRRFAADASHELRTPLAAIRGYAELYRQGAVSSEEVPRTLRRIEDEAKRMGSLVEDLLLLARLDEQRPARRAPVDLAVLAGDAVHDARGLDPQRTVTLTGLGTAGPVPAAVVGDEDRLRQVAANLVANAVRHTPAGSPIEVAVGLDGDLAVFEVRDHGPGLTPEQATRVFERFYRVDSSRRRDTGGGSGLGLSIVAAVVAAHGGTVAALPTPGGGATFRVCLPTGQDGPDGAGAATAAEGPGDLGSPLRGAASTLGEVSSDRPISPMSNSRDT